MVLSSRGSSPDVRIRIPSINRWQPGAGTKLNRYAGHDIRPAFHLQRQFLEHLLNWRMSNWNCCEVTAVKSTNRANIYSMSSACFSLSLPLSPSCVSKRGQVLWSFEYEKLQGQKFVRIDTKAGCLASVLVVGCPQGFRYRCGYRYWWWAKGWQAACCACHGHHYTDICDVRQMSLWSDGWNGTLACIIFRIIYFFDCA